MIYSVGSIFLDHIIKINSFPKNMVAFAMAVRLVIGLLETLTIEGFPFLLMWLNLLIIYILILEILLLF